MTTVWVLIVYMAGQPSVKDLLDYKTKADCEHMIAALSDPTFRAKGAQGPTGFQRVEAHVQQN